MEVASKKVMGNRGISCGEVDTASTEIRHKMSRSVWWKEGARRRKLGKKLRSNKTKSSNFFCL